MNRMVISRSVANFTEEVTECPICGAGARMDSGSCVGCLLRTGLGKESSNGADVSREGEAREDD